MTFGDYWTNAAALGMKTDDHNRAIAVCAWDAALCALQEQMFDRGKLKDAGAIAAAATNLHTWVKPS
jgi:hypothetical protein